MNIQNSKILKLVLTLIGIMCFVLLMRILFAKNSTTLADYAKEDPQRNVPIVKENLPDEGIDDSNPSYDMDEGNENDGFLSSESNSETYESEEASEMMKSNLLGLSLNGDTQCQMRILYQDGFYYEPLSTRLTNYITGISYPSEATDSNGNPIEITYDDLRYVHILHYNFAGEATEGELICNERIAQDLVEIFYELYTNNYQLEKVLLIDEYNGDDNLSMADNNSSCFNYRVVEGTTNLSMHARGLAVDINPLYNPYITYDKSGNQKVAPENGIEYVDRSAYFPYKIDTNDLAFRLFKEHGFSWGGDWNSVKDYQHFQKK